MFGEWTIMKIMIVELICLLTTISLLLYIKITSDKIERANQGQSTQLANRSFVYQLGNIITRIGNTTCQVDNRVTQQGIFECSLGNNVNQKNNIVNQTGNNINQSNINSINIGNTTIEHDNVFNQTNSSVTQQGINSIQIGSGSNRTENSLPLTDPNFMQKLSTWIKKKVTRTLENNSSQDNVENVCPVTKTSTDVADIIPTYWSCHEQFTNASSLLSQALPKYCQVDSTTKNEIVQLIKSTWNSELVHQSIDVFDVLRIENIQLFLKYDSARKALLRKLNRPCQPILKLPWNLGEVLTYQSFMRTELFRDINEYYLFYGAPPSCIDSIARDGLSQNSVGRAIWCTESSMKADQYTVSMLNSGSANGDNSIFLIRAILGEVFVISRDELEQNTNEDLKQVSSSSGHEKYGSVMVDGESLLREFAFYKSNLCYPEFLIKYRKM